MWHQTICKILIIYLLAGATGYALDNTETSGAAAQQSSQQLHNIISPSVKSDDQSQTVVKIGPYFGLPTKFNDENLVVFASKINTDVTLLFLRQALLLHNTNANYPHLLLSGNLAGITQYQSNSNSPVNSNFGGQKNNFDLSNAKLDFVVLMPSPWITGFININYDSEADSILSNAKYFNSRLYINNAFITVGDFAQSPFYASFGQIYVPFGRYSSIFVSSPLTSQLGQTKARAMLVGYQGQNENAFYTSLYAFQGESYITNNYSINNGGIDVGYKFYAPKFNLKAEFGAGWIANIADAVRMQYTGAAQGFGGFSSIIHGNEKLVHRVPALNLRGKVLLNSALAVSTEYIHATTNFAQQDLSFVQHGAQPSAVHSEISYMLDAFNHPFSVGLMYDKTLDALALGVPQKRYGAVLNSSIWRNTSQSIELRRDIHYASNAFATGAGVMPYLNGLGATSNVISLQFDVYF